jgi:signal transduction histidine kinase
VVRRPAVALTKLGFRRDVRLFLVTLIGFLVTLTVILIALSFTTLRQTEMVIRASREPVASSIADSVPLDLGAADAEVEVNHLRNITGVTGVQVSDDKGHHLTAGFVGPGTETITLKRGVNRVIVAFDQVATGEIRTRAIRIGIVTLIAAFASTLLLLYYLPRITEPVEELLDHARGVRDQDSHEDETGYLIETFRNSIATLRSQEEQLKRLHEGEKRRADDLQLVTATLTRSLTNGFMAVDRDAKVVDINGAGRELLESIGLNVVNGSALSTLIPHPFGEAIQPAYESRAALTRQEIVMPETESGAVVGFTTVPLTNEGGDFAGMLVLFSDLTEVKRMENRLRDSHTLAELGQISAGIAHEFRNSLSTILGYLKLARRDATDAVDKRLRFAEDESVLLLRAVDGLLAFARPVPMDRQRFDASTMVREVVERLDPDDGNPRFVLELEPLIVDGDESLLSRAVENVVRNAIDAVRLTLRGSGTVTVQTGAGRLRVTDDGVGLDEADVPRLLLPFQSEKPEGHGLGLALTKKIVMVHGGEIRITGAPGTGATVELAFPDVAR